MKTKSVAMALLAGGLVAAHARATTFTWTGATNSAYDNPSNWNPSSGFPDDQNDGARIDVTANTPVVFSTGTYSVEGISLNSDSNAAIVGVTVTGGSLTTAGTVFVKGDQDGTATATIAVTGGTFAPNSFAFVGRNDPANGHAKVDFDVDVTVAATPNSTIVKGGVDFDVAATKVFAAKALVVGAGTDPATLTIGPGTGEVDATVLEIEVGDSANENVTVDLNAGTLDVNGRIRLKASNSLDAIAELEVSSGTTCTPDSLDLQGGGTAARAVLLDLAESVSLVSASATPVTGFGQVKIVNSEILTLNQLDIGDGATFGDLELLGSSSLVAKLRTTKLVIKGGTSAVSRLKGTFNHGQIETTD